MTTRDEASDPPPTMAAVRALVAETVHPRHALSRRTGLGKLAQEIRELIDAAKTKGPSASGARACTGRSTAR